MVRVLAYSDFGSSLYSIFWYFDPCLFDFVFACRSFIKFHLFHLTIGCTWILSLSPPFPVVTEQTRHYGIQHHAFFFVNHDHNEDFLFSIWSQNPEFARHHSDYHSSVLAPPSTPVTPSAPSVWLGGLTLPRVIPSTPKSPSPFSGTRLAFCPRNYGPRSRCQGRNSKPLRRNPLPVDGGPILHPSVFAPSPILPQASSPDLP